MGIGSRCPELIDQRRAEEAEVQALDAMFAMQEVLEAQQKHFKTLEGLKDVLSNLSDEALAEAETLLVSEVQKRHKADPFCTLKLRN